MNHAEIKTEAGSFELSYLKWLDAVQYERHSFNQFIEDLCTAADAHGISYDYLRMIDDTRHRDGVMSQLRAVMVNKEELVTA